METINNITINTQDIELMRSLAIGGYIDGWAHAFAFCNNCDNYHTVSQGPDCHNGHSIMHRTNAQTNYLYIPDPVVGQAANPASLPQPAPQIGADQEVPQQEEEYQEDIILFPQTLLLTPPTYSLYDDDESDEDDLIH